MCSTICSVTKMPGGVQAKEDGEHVHKLLGRLAAVVEDSERYHGAVVLNPKVLLCSGIVPLCYKSTKEKRLAMQRKPLIQQAREFLFKKQGSSWRGHWLMRHSIGRSARKDSFQLTSSAPGVSYSFLG